LFAVIVVLPTLLAAVYYLFIAAPMYESVAQFVVLQKTEVSTPQGQSGGLLASMGLGGGSADQGREQEVIQYMKSRDAVAELDRAHNLRAMLDRPGADFWSRFPRPFEGTTFENLYDGFQRFLIAGLDPQTGIATMRVKAYTPEDARAIANSLLDGGEALVNTMNERSLADSVGQAERQVADAEKAAAKAQTELTVFRNRERLVDPDLATQSSQQLMVALQGQLASIKAQRSGLAASAPQNPQLPILDRSIAAYQAQIDAETARSAGEANSLAPKVGTYERLSLDQEIAGKSLAAAEEAAETARLEALRQQLYLERVVNPNLPDKAEQPKRMRNLFTVFLVSLVIYAAVSLLVAGFREHRQH
jgi:BexC/CtrB/KpsE family polysaccharide export inner-membrane protein